MKLTHKNFFSFLMLLLVTFHVNAQTKDNIPLKLRVGTYNIGHFNQGRLGGFQGTGNIVKAELQNWKNWIGKESLDLFIVNEWNKHFDKDSTYNAENELLKPFYNNIYFGKENRWIYNGIATNYQLKNIRQVNWSGDYYAVIGDLVIGKKTITILSTHIPWQKEWHAPSLDALIAELKKYEYFICLGDINAFDDAQLKFVKEGFNMANGGHMGWFTTAGGTMSATGRKGSPNTNIDNIITSKNIKIMNVSAPFTGLNDLDHLPVLADVVITW
jgi:endonuclease/exonuclease/phosphatase family metal-dependent hydrolase